ncbi:MAG: hypothetical protein HGB00_06555 [Chlorobiaceae bacterium]|nr:hypothetical protein [Chlorobiaceae bacterium]
MTERISSFWLHRILGIPASTPLSPTEMAAALQVAVCPAPEMSPRLERFTAALREAFMQCGVTILDGDESIGQNGRIKAGTAVIAPGIFPDELLPINRVSTLYNNIIVGIYDEPPPVHDGHTPQQTLDAVVGRLAWDMVHLLIYVTDDSWTVCSMNGGITTIGTSMPGADTVLESLIPKLTAQVVPPRPEDLEIRPGTLDTSEAGFSDIAADFVECGIIWAGNSRFMSHTSRESLAYRNSFYRKIVARYLDDRSGMSYGFFARQLPVDAAPATVMESLCDWIENSPAACACTHHVPLILAGHHLLVPVPDVRILTTRSGCRKTEIDGRHDLVEIGLDNGRAYLGTPADLPPELVSKPSFDTLTIIAHAVGNAMISSILQALRPDSPFPQELKTRGASMSHWHYYPENDMVPEGFVLHGQNNPPVSCSTPQSAAYSLLGKLDALEQAIEHGTEYLGDVHIEPGHGTNLVGMMSLAETATALNRRECDVLASRM